MRANPLCANEKSVGVRSWRLTISQHVGGDEVKVGEVKVRELLLEIAR